jgi:hypothetical protein
MNNGQLSASIDDLANKARLARWAARGPRPVSLMAGRGAGMAGRSSLVALRLPQQLRQPRDVDRDAPRLVGGEHLRLPRFVFVLAAVEVGKNLPIGVADNVAAGDLVGMPGRGEAAGGSGIMPTYHGALHREMRALTEPSSTSTPAPAETVVRHVKSGGCVSPCAVA